MEYKIGRDFRELHAMYESKDDLPKPSVNFVSC